MVATTVSGQARLRHGSAAAATLAALAETAAAMAVELDC